MKLLVTRMVANSFFGRFKSLAIICIVVEFFSKPFSMLDLVKEKTATSAPEISAELRNKIKRTTILVINVKSIASKMEIKSAGSESKIREIKMANHLFFQQQYLMFVVVFAVHF